MSYDVIEYWRNRLKTVGTINSVKLEDETIDPIEERLIRKYIPEMSLIMDYGVGGGRLFPLYDDMNFYVVGCDIADFTDIIKFKCPYLRYEHFIFDSSIKTVFANDSFEYIVSFMVLLHQTHDNISKVIAELYRVCSDTCIISSWEPVVKPVAPETYCFAHDYEKLYTEAGFTIVESVRADDRIKFYVLKK